MTTDDKTKRVLIAGAGPSGLVCALALAQRGIPVAVFEALPDRALDLRASTIHPPTMEMLDQLGVMPTLISQGLTSAYWQFRDRQTGPLAIFDLSLLGDETKFAFRLQCEQFKVTAALQAELEKHPHASIQFSHKATGVKQDGQGVELTLDHHGESITERGSYLIAADGASSVLRRELGVPFHGYTFPERFLLVSTPFEFKELMPDLSISNYITDPTEWLVMLRVKDFWRVLFPTNPGDSDLAVMQDAVLQSRLHGIAGQGGPFEIAHKTLYAVHQRVAESYRHGRVILVGDAAHINNPLGGMGMNGGIHDAMNLAGNLAQVLEGASADLLDRYSRQRRAVAINYVEQWTVRNREIMRETDPAVRAANLADLRRIGANPVSARAYLRKTSMMDSLDYAAAIE